MLCTLLAALAAAVAGCDGAPAAREYSVLVGWIESYNVETGDLTLRVTQVTGDRPSADVVQCQVTRDTEIYVNDMFRTMDHIRVGDRAELVGYHDPNPRIERFVVSYAHLDQRPPPPAPPDLQAWPAADGEPAPDIDESGPSDGH